MRFYLDDLNAMPLDKCSRKRMCKPGLRKFFAVRGWDWNDFLENGRLVADLRGEDDAMVTRFIDFVERRRAE